jgi:K+-transporting ATPase ATPase C chain
MRSFITSLRVAIVSMLVCVMLYTALILGIAQIFTPHTANGSLIFRDQRSEIRDHNQTSDLRPLTSEIIGSELIAQKFERPEYFWPRPSAVDYNAAGAGGSNKSPTSPELAERAREIIAKHGATAENPLPPELAAASGSGLDPNLTMDAALYQVGRIAQARGLSPSQIEALIADLASTPAGFLTPADRGRLVNVLDLNLALDAIQHQTQLP